MRAFVPVLVSMAMATGFAQVTEQAPTFRSEINYVQLPVRVLDERGELVRGLAQGDFRVLEDGRPQPISTFSFVEVAVVPRDASVPDAPVALLEPIASNEPELVDGRVFAFVLDDYHTEAGQTLKVRGLLTKFIQENLSANDIAAVVLTGGARGQNFTRNRRLLLDVVDRFIGQFDADPGIVRNSSLVTQTVIRQMTGLAESLGAIKGRHKALVFVSPSSLCGLVGGECIDDMRKALRSAVRSDVSFYVVDPTGLNTSRHSRAENSNPYSTYSAGADHESPDERAARAAFGEARAEFRGPLDGARYLAEESGGFAVVNTNNLEGGLDRIVRETSAYYLIGYYSTNQRADGRFRKHEIAISRRDAQVLHRAGYLEPRDVAAVRKPGAVSAGTAPTVREQLQELARSPLPVSGMTMHLAAAPFLSADGKASVAVIVEMPSETLKFTESNGRYRIGLGLSIGFYDRNGKSLGGDDPNMELSLPVNVGKRMTAQGVRMISRIVVPPGTYRLWAGATHLDGGLRGSVVTEIDVPDFDLQPLAISGLAVTTAAASRMYTPRPDDLLNDVLGAPPSARRTFSRDQDLWIYGEIYDHRSNGGDVASTVVVTAADGKMVYERPLEAAPVQFGYLAKLPLRDLAPGSYVVTFDARSSLPDVVSARRSISIKVQ